MGVFPIINRINHSCAPNCSVHWNPTTNKEEVFLMKDLDEERDEYETRELYHIDLGNSVVWGMQCFCSVAF